MKPNSKNEDNIRISGLEALRADGWKTLVINSYNEIVFEHNDVILSVKEYPFNNLMSINDISYRVISEKVDVEHKLATILVK